MKKAVKLISFTAGFLILAASITGYIIYRKVFSPNIFLNGKNYLYIPQDADFNTVKDSLYANFRVEDKTMFEFTAQRKNYTNKIKPGRYKIQDGMSNNALINLLRSGEQSPVNLTFNNIRTIKQLCSKVSHQIDIDSNYLYSLLQDDNFMNKYGFDHMSCSAMFIPDTYQMYWNTSAEKFIEKMYGYYQKFWNEERKAKASKINLTPLEVSTLASIVQMEQAQHKEEQPIIAGLYINRLKIGMPLQSCPTLIFALGDFSIKRVSGKMLETDSPYNTYKNPGLPPSPICFPEESALKAVLDYEHNDYLYMCAKSDFSGYHFFSKSYEEQKRHAKDFQKELDRKGIH
ncbi:MAG: endolytic transglycosylase MltG [Bacteroidales bacterium]|nr:endolytic transglycosylase MltG [Bacteroidales bacterium]